MILVKIEEQTASEDGKRNSLNWVGEEREGFLDTLSNLEYVGLLDEWINSKIYTRVSNYWVGR